jgi:hypothetical protein
MKNKLYELYQEQAETFDWFKNLDPESLRFLLLATWYIMLWNPADVEQKLVKFYGGVIDGPKVLGLIEAMKRRFIYSDKYAWAVPTDEAIGVLCEHSPLVEVGAGRGYWARLAAEAGADISAFDAFPPGGAEENRWHHSPEMFFSVAQADAEIAGRYPDRTLLLCWPPWGSDVASRALRSYRGETIIYVGDEGLSTATPDFYAELATGFTKVRVVEIPQWPGINDRLEVWQRSAAGAVALS